LHVTTRCLHDALPILDNVSFKHPVKLGDVISIEAQVTRAFTTSVEVRMVVWAENIPSGTRVKSNEAFYTFVAIDQHNEKVTVPRLIPETEEEQKLYNEALQRRELRLVLGGKLKPKDAKELQNLFKEVVKA